MKRIGVDVGGTFTDLILVDEEAGRITVDKVPSTPDDPVPRRRRGRPRRSATKAGVALAEVDNLLHGTTVATNIVLTHSGAEVGMITTRGLPRHPPHRAAQEAVQLLAAAGAALAVAAARQAPPPADGQGARDRPGRRRARPARRGRGARARARSCKDAGVEAVAVCLLHSYLNPAHERRDQGDRARGVPGGVPLGLARGAAALPRVRALLDRLPERVRRARRSSRYVARFDEALREDGLRARACS